MRTVYYRTGNASKTTCFQSVDGMLLCRVGSVSMVYPIEAITYPTAILDPPTIWNRYLAEPRDRASPKAESRGRTLKSSSSPDAISSVQAQHSPPQTR